MKRKKLRLLKCINGTKGVIALFLAILMTPFLAVATVLVETGRYNSAVSILDEAMGASAISTLANYDTFLRERWGLLALSQDTDIDALFNQYFDINKGVLGNSLKLNSPINAKGLYPLSNRSTLNAQLLEYAKYNAPTRLATAGITLAFDEIFNLIEKLKNFDKFVTEILKSFTTVNTVISSTKTLIQSTKNLEKSTNQIVQYQTFYNECYDEFERTVTELASALDSTSSEEGTDADIESLKENTQTAKESYMAIMDDLISAFSDCVKEFKNCLSATISISSSASSLMPGMVGFGMNHTSGVSSDIAKYSETAAKAAQKGTEATLSNWNSIVNENEENVFGEIIKELERLKEKVNSFDINSVSSSTSITKEEYYYAIKDHLTAKEITKFIAQQAVDLIDDSILTYLNSLNTVINEIFKTQLFFDPSLSNIIDSQFYKDNIGGLPGSILSDEMKALITSISDLLNSITTIKESLSLESLDLIAAYDAFEDAITSSSKVFENLKVFVNGIVERLDNVMRNQLWYSTYSTYNLTCRTDNKTNGTSYTTMTNYKIGPSATTTSSLYLPKSNITSSNISIIDDFSAIVENVITIATGTGADITFSGAEIEYIIGGTNSEVGNQLATFLGLYILRLIIDLIPVFTDPDAQAMAAAATIGYPAVMAIIAFVEPLIDTILLVNGEKVPLIKLSGIYASPTGIPKVIDKIIKLPSSVNSSISGSITSTLPSRSASRRSPIFIDSSRGIARMSDRLLNEAEADFNEETPANFSPNSSKETPVENEKISTDKEKPAEESTEKDNEKLKDLISLGYREHCFIFLFLMIPNQLQLMRLQNLIQMESTYYYQQKNGADFVFDLNKAYTYIDSEADVSIKQMLPSLADSSLFTIKRKNYRGY